MKYLLIILAFLMIFVVTVNSISCFDFTCYSICGARCNGDIYCAKYQRACSKNRCC
uniref:Uncharacterized protein n=1 Tax=Meloidogyne enterolobii TaxID=390850 RepID=A0A6V7TII8_MELEN|nr:unnamed protein product [Meloidogyne enterolobii]